MTDRREVGLCFTCKWMRVAANRRGSVFYRCARADADPRYPRYPVLPRVACDGYEESPRAESSSSSPR